MNFLLENWTSLITVSGLITALGSAIRYGPRVLRRIAVMLDCELDRLRWEEADRLRNREINLLRQSVDQLQNDINRLLNRAELESPGSSAVSGAASVTDAPTAPTAAPVSPTTTPSTNSGTYGSKLTGHDDR